MARPKGSKNKPKGSVVAVSNTPRRPRGRPRKLEVASKLPNTDSELDNDGVLSRLELSEIDDDDYNDTRVFTTHHWTSDENGLDSFSIGIDSMY